MQSKPNECAGCALYKIGEGFVPAWGSGSNGVALVGMAPAANEILRGEPFVGRAGTVLSKILRKVDLRENFAIWNTIQCRGPNDALDWEGASGAITHCGVHRRNYADQFRRSVTVALGSVPFHTYVGRSIPISKARGYRFETEEGPVVATYHPSFLGRGKMNLIPVVIWDLNFALAERGRPPVEWPMADLTLYPSPDDFREWCRDAEATDWLAHDIETPKSKLTEDENGDIEDESFQLLRFSLARSDFKAITAPWQEPFITILFEFLAGLGCPRIGWNSDAFDDPREAANGWPMTGRRIDAQWLWNHLQKTLPRGLGFVSPFYDRTPEWKSLGSDGSDPELYSAMDARQCGKIYVGVKKALEAKRL